MPIALPSPQLLRIHGADAVAFAHAQFTSDVRALAVGRWQWSAWLSAQGRVRFFFRVLRNDDDRLTLFLQGGSAEAMRSTLAPYVFRSKVTLSCADGISAWGCERREDVEPWLGTVPGVDDIVVSGGRTGISLSGKDSHWVVFGDADSSVPADAGADGSNRWQLAQVQAGIVTLDAAQSDRFLPFWIGLDELGAISVRKGCYPGQEIIARMHFKGGNKRQLRRLAFEATALPPTGTALQAGASGGEILQAAWTGRGQGLALAIVPFDLIPGPLEAPGLPHASFRVLSPDASANA